MSIYSSIAFSFACPFFVQQIIKVDRETQCTQKWALSREKGPFYEKAELQKGSERVVVKLRDKLAVSDELFRKWSATVFRNEDEIGIVSAGLRGRFSPPFFEVECHSTSNIIQLESSCWRRQGGMSTLQDENNRINISCNGIVKINGIPIELGIGLYLFIRVLPL